MRVILSRLDPRAVPIITRLANLNARPSVDAMITVSLLTFVASVLISGLYLYALSLASTAYFITGALIRQLALVVMVIAAGYLLLLPAVIAGFAAMLASRDLQSEGFTLLRLTSISGQAVFQAYVIAAIYRLRVLLGAAFGVIPLYATSLAPVSLIFITIINGSPFSILMGWDIVLRMLYYLMVGVGLWGMSFFAAVMGVNVGLRAFSPTAAASIAPIGVVIMMVGVWLILNGYVAPMFSAPIADLYSFAIVLILLAGFVIAIAPFLATFNALRRANRPLPDARTESLV